MGEKVNYNPDNKKNNKKIKLSLIIIAVLIVVYIIIQSVIAAYKSIPNETQNNKASYQYVKDYNSLEEIFNHFNCRLISKEETEDILKVYVRFDVDLYTGEHSNENHFMNLCKAIAEFINFKNFELVDTAKNIDIEVICERPNIVQIKINGDINYYLNHDSDLNKRKLQSGITDFTIQSNELQQLINNDWNESKVDWGTKDSTCNDYNIYFDEGIKYKVVSRNVYNVLFTDKYPGQVAGGLNVGCSPEEVEDALGTPTFSNNEELYGYLGENNYLFFDFMNNEISVYPLQTITKEDEDKLKKYIEDMNSSKDIKEFAKNLTDMWIDYDVYNFDSNYVDLRYTLKGVQLSINNNSLKNGIFIYQNYSGNRDISSLENVYIQENDFVKIQEENRQISEALSRSDEGDFDEETLKKYLGIEFSIRFRSFGKNSSSIGPLFYSKNKLYPDSELDRFLEVSSYMWIDDYRVIYSVNNDGIYVYDCRTRVNKKIIDINDKIIINDVEDGKIIYNDTEILSVEQN